MESNQHSSFERQIYSLGDLPGIIFGIYRAHGEDRTRDLLVGNETQLPLCYMRIQRVEESNP